MAREHMRSWKIGDVTVTRIVEIWNFTDHINMTLKDGQPEEVLALEWLHPHYATPDGQQVMNFQGFVVQAPGLNVMLDTCIGNERDRFYDVFANLNTSFIADLGTLGLTPADIDVVLCTHLHFDHVGWNTRLDNGRWVPTFPNARYLFSRRDFEHFRDTNEESDHAAAFLDSIVPVMEAGLGEIVEADIAVHREIADGVWLEPAFGHSPGCCTIHARREGPEALFWGDVVHHPIQLVRPDLPFFFDMDIAAASATRRRVLERAADGDITCFPAHFRSTSAGQVRRDGDVYRYEFVPG